MQPGVREESRRQQPAPVLSPPSSFRAEEAVRERTAAAATVPRTLLWVFALVCLLVPLRRQYALSFSFGESMLPTLAAHNLLVIDQTAYGDCEPSRGDIVVARYHDEFLVKRIVGLPGEEVEVRNGIVYVNNEATDERDHIKQGPLAIGKGRLLRGRFAILGDNRAATLPVHAVISQDRIVGKVVCWVAL